MQLKLQDLLLGDGFDELLLEILVLASQFADHFGIVRLEGGGRGRADGHRLSLEAPLFEGECRLINTNTNGVAL